MDFEFDYNSLSKRFSEAKHELDETFFSLKKLCNYENENSFVQRGFQKQLFMPLGRKFPTKETSPKQNKFSNSSESEESASDDDHSSKKVALQSAIIAKVETSKARKKFNHMYNSDRKVQLRHRRFLGMVQNTLQKFQDEEVKRQPQDLKRKRALEKVEAAVENEKISVQRERAELISKSRKQQLKLECLEKMMGIAESFELWENNQKNLLNYIATKTEPQIFFLPAIPSSTSKKEIERSRKEIKEKIEKQKAFVETVLFKIKQSYGFLWIPNNTEETPLISEVDSQNVLKSEITSEETKVKDEEEETLYLDLSENEFEDLY